jgi:hypothetical protein
MLVLVLRWNSKRARGANDFSPVCGRANVARRGDKLKKRRDILMRGEYRSVFLLLGITSFLTAFSAVPSAQAAEKTYTNSIGMEFVLIPAGRSHWSQWETMKLKR